MNEKPPSLEQPDKKQRIIEGLRERGPEDPETRTLLQEWLSEEEKKAAALNTPEAQVRLEIKRAELYFAGGFPADALEDFRSALFNAQHLGQKTLMDEIDQRIKELFPQEKESPFPQREGYRNFTEVMLELFSDEPASLAHYIDGSAGLPKLSDGLRFEGNPGDHRTLFIHEDDLEEFVRRVKARYENSKKDKSA